MNNIVNIDVTELFGENFHIEELNTYQEEENATRILSEDNVTEGKDIKEVKKGKK